MGKRGRRLSTAPLLHAAIETLEPRYLFAIRYVDINAPGPIYDGTSWANAYTELRTAMIDAVSGDTIRVADGVYKPTATTSRGLSFFMESGVSTLGGYAGYGAPNPDARDIVSNVTTLSGDVNVPGDNSDNTYNVVGASNVTNGLLDGFVITGGSDINAGANHGGGINISGGSPTISNCTFIGNRSTNGGAVYAAFGSVSGTFTNCQFIGNSASTSGGALYLDFASTTVFTGCTFKANSATNGGAVYVTTNASTPSLSNCAFVANSATGYGGAIYLEKSITIPNCTLVANRAAGGGAGYGTGGVFTNCILWGNIASVKGNQTFNPGVVGFVMASSYSNVEGGPGTGTGNISSDPVFFRNPSAGNDKLWGTADDDYGDVRISAASPAVDAGNNSNVPAGITTDLGGAARFQNVPTTTDTGVGTAPIVDMGAYEAAPALTVSAGGPYVGNPTGINSKLTLTARGASNLSGALAYAWEWSGDGQFNEASGASIQFPLGAFAGGSTVSVSVRMTDSASRTVVAASSVRVAPDVLYVDHRASAGSQDGFSWANAFTNLTDALAQAAGAQTIRVAWGTYLPSSTGDRTATFQLKTNVSVLGGYAGNSNPSAPDARDWDLYPTILSGDIGNPNDSSDNSYHVLISHGTASGETIEGLTVANGRANGTGLNNSGGGVYMANSLTVRNCRFTDNYASSSGGAIFSDPGFLNPGIYFCTFIGNHATQGGAYYNSAEDSIPKVEDCTFTANTASSAGGAIYNSSYTGNTAVMTLRRSDFTGNSAPTGGAVYIGAVSDAESPRVFSCRFARNSATSGGGMYIFGSDPVLEYLGFVDNSAANGGGIYFASAGSPKLYNSTFSANRATTRGGAIYSSGGSPKIYNSILWGDSAPSNPEFYSASGSPVFLTCDVQGGISGASNINVDPRFVRTPGPGVDLTWGTSDDDYGDLRLQPNSPCIDVSDPSNQPSSTTTDLARNDPTVDYPGVNDPGVIRDLGGYETQLTPSWLTYSVGAQFAFTGRTSGPAVLTLTSGSFTFTGDASVTDVDLGVTVSAGASLTLAASQHLGPLIIAGSGSSASIASGASRVVAITSLSIGGSGTLDVSDNALIVNYGASAPSPLATIKSFVLSGRGGTDFANAPWNGPGINSSAASLPDGVSFALGYADNSFLPQLGLSSYSTFFGQSVDSTSILIRYTKGADVNLDGRVNTDDVTIVGALYNNAGSGEWFLGDFDYDGIVDTDDVTVLGAMYDPTAPALALAMAAFSSQSVDVEGPKSSSPAITTEILSAEPSVDSLKSPPGQAGSDAKSKPSKGPK